MTPIAHLASHDVRSQRIPLLAFAALLTLEATWIGRGFVPMDAWSVASWIPWLRGVMVALITGLVIQRDSLVGTTAFWRTRPIGRGTLLASKLSSLALLLVLTPALILGTAWWTTGLLTADVRAATLTIAAEHAAIVLITAMAAVVTGSLTHLVIAGTAGIALVTLANGVLLPSIMVNWPFVGDSLGGLKPALYFATLIAFGLLAVAHQYLTLREWRTAALVALAVVAAAVPPRMLAWNWNGNPAALDRSVVNADDVSLSVAPGSLHAPDEAALAGASTGQKVSFAGKLTVSGLLEGQFVRPLSMTGTLLGAENQAVPFSTTPGYRLLSGVSVEAPWSGMQAALGDSRLLTMPVIRPAGQASLFALATIDRQAAGRLGPRPQVLVADVTLAVGRFRVVAAVPFKPGASFAADGNAWTVMTVGAGTMDVGSIRASRMDRSGAFPRLGNPVVVLRNREKREAVRVLHHAYRAGLAGALGMLGVRPGQYSATLRLTWTEVPVDGSDLRTIIDADWLAGAELVYLDVEDLGTFTRPLRAEFTIPDGTPEQ